MKKSLGTYMLIFFLAAFSGVIAIGGQSIYMVHRILQKTYSIEEESKNVAFVSQIHNKTYNLVLAIHHFIIDSDEKYAGRATALLTEIENDLQKYIQYEEAEEESGNSESSREELRLLRLLGDNLRGIRGIVPVFEDFARKKTGDVQRLIYLEKYAYNIETLTLEINKLHFEKITKKVEKSQGLLSFIFTLYVALSGAGLLSVFIGYWLHGRYIVKPISNLAAATQKLSRQGLSFRVDVNSKTEIGVLYDSFNTMAERLQSKEKQLVDFNRSLEQKVNERTYELKDAYDSLKKTQNELVRLEKIAAMGQIAASVNHEIKTPLNSLYMNLQLLKKQVAQCGGEDSYLKKDVINIISLIDGEALRISGILEEFVRFARFSPPDLKENDLNKIIADVADMISQRADAARVRLQLKLSGNVPRFMFDDKKIIRALINLCINAIHSMPEGGILTIETTVGEDNTVSLKVSDTGTGINAEDIDKIFQPFFSKKEAGLGLGLAIVQSIIEGHGGRISCASKVGEGTTFEALLPVAGGIPEAKEQYQ
ncbi:MAG: hypothetical protein CVV37_03965 [Nitrospira bacterium HGW-Nitrospira-1]|nr:MAG: hypothetical protein CVV37_03965 [Nitrospira bacterium HGW-Nitrospira-1]